MRSKAHFKPTNEKEPSENDSGKSTGQNTGNHTAYHNKFGMRLVYFFKQREDSLIRTCTDLVIFTEKDKKGLNFN